MGLFDMDWNNIGLGVWTFVLYLTTTTTTAATWIHIEIRSFAIKEPKNVVVVVQFLLLPQFFPSSRLLFLLLHHHHQHRHLFNNNENSILFCVEGNEIRNWMMNKILWAHFASSVFSDFFFLGNINNAILEIFTWPIDVVVAVVVFVVGSYN